MRCKKASLILQIFYFMCFVQSAPPKRSFFREKSEELSGRRRQTAEKGDGGDPAPLCPPAVPQVFLKV
jgi:hypothetical protein